MFTLDFSIQKDALINNSLFQTQNNFYADCNFNAK